MRIAYLADPRTGNGFYRAVGPMTALEHYRGHEVRQLPADAPRPPLESVRDVDLLYIHRYCDKRAQLLAREAKDNGAAVVWDNDDDMGSFPKGAAGYKHYGGLAWERRLADMQRIFRIADLVTAPSTALAHRFAKLGATHTDVVENHVPDQFLGQERPPHDGVTIGWIAGLEHQMDAERLPIRAVLQRLLDERDDVNVTSIGLGLGLTSSRYRTTSLVPILELSRHAAGFDIAIAPIAELAFNRARSNIKLKEYAAGGAPWLASPVGPYAAMGERQGGRLVSDDAWYDELLRLVENPRERRKLAKRAVKWVAGETLSANVGAWERTLTAVVERAAP